MNELQPNSSTPFSDAAMIRAHCPRCGYDVRGVIDTWTESCPLLGTCSECGLEYQWSQVLHPEKYEPLWCVEFRSAGPLGWAAIKTYLMSFRPWRFFSELKMANVVRWRRLTVYVLLLITPLLAAYLIEQTVIAVMVWRINQQQLTLFQQGSSANLPWYQRQLDDLIASGTATDQEITILKNQINSMKAFAQTTGSISFTQLEAIVEAVVFPLRSYSNGAVLTPSMSWSYTAPLKLHELALAGSRRTINMGRLFGMRFDKIMINIITQGVLFPGIALAFLLLPFSRHMAKVRWAHIIRVFLYSLYLPVTMVCLLVILFGVGTLMASLEPLCNWMGDVLFTYGTWIALIAWWALAVKHYLKMPHGWVVAILFAMMIGLISLMAMFFLTPSLVINV